MTPAGAIETTAVARWMREALWAYPMVEAVHILCLAVVVGSIVIVDLRLLGFSRGLSVSRLARHALPWTLGAFVVAAFTGLLMFTAHAEDFLTNRVFMVKMGLILLAGINAGLRAGGGGSFTLDRTQAYIGVLIDDLVTCGTREPYRLFTSRAEYRLLLREDNADTRLSRIGSEIGLLDDATYQRFLDKERQMADGITLLDAIAVKATAEVNEALAAIGQTGIRQKSSLTELLRRPGMTIGLLAGLPLAEQELQDLEALTRSPFKDEVQLQIKFAGYIERQNEQVERFRKMESLILPEDIDYKALSGLSNEVVEKLGRVRPRSLGQASRISGITPAAISVLQVHIKRLKTQR